MKKLIALGMTCVMSLGMTGNILAEEMMIGVPTLISETEELNEEAVPFTIDQDGNTFKIIVSENASTGYVWQYEIKDLTMVEFIGEEVEVSNSDEMIVGAPSEKAIKFNILSDGVTTINFQYVRPFGDEEVAETFTILVYKNGEVVSIEEDGIVMISALEDSVEPTLYELNKVAIYNGEEIAADVDVQIVNGITMIPLRATLEAMGYTVTWNGQTKSVEISKGAIWTSITIGENAYFKHRMSAQELSVAPLLMNQRTFVPVEFFAEIIGTGIQVESQTIEFLEEEASVMSGYVKGITYDETGAMAITLTTDITSEDMMYQTIIHTSDASTIFQKEVVEGELIKVVTSAVMTMSIPGQTAGYVIY